MRHNHLPCPDLQPVLDRRRRWRSLTVAQERTIQDCKLKLTDGCSQGMFVDHGSNCSSCLLPDVSLKRRVVFCVQKPLQCTRPPLCLNEKIPKNITNQVAATAVSTPRQGPGTAVSMANVSICNKTETAGSIDQGALHGYQFPANGIAKQLQRSWRPKAGSGLRSHSHVCGNTMFQKLLDSCIHKLLQAKLCR